MIKFISLLFFNLFLLFFGLDLFPSVLLICKYTKLCNIVQVFVILFLIFFIYFKYLSFEYSFYFEFS